MKRGWENGKEEKECVSENERKGCPKKNNF